MDKNTVPLARREQFAAELLRGCILAVQLGGPWTPDQEAAVAEVGNRAFGASRSSRTDRDKLTERSNAATASKIRAGDYLTTVSKAWPQSQRIEALQAIFLCVSAGGYLSPTQNELLTRLQDIFDLTDAEYRMAIDEAVENARCDDLVNHDAVRATPP